MSALWYGKYRKNAAAKKFKEKNPYNQNCQQKQENF